MIIVLVLGIAKLRGTMWTKEPMPKILSIVMKFESITNMSGNLKDCVAGV